jgi:hypothetical protein
MGMDPRKSGMGMGMDPRSPAVRGSHVPVPVGMGMDPPIPGKSGIGMGMIPDCRRAEQSSAVIKWVAL